MIRIEGIEVVAARLAAVQKELTSKPPRGRKLHSRSVARQNRSLAVLEVRKEAGKGCA